MTTNAEEDLLELHVLVPREDARIIKEAFGFGSCSKFVRAFISAVASRTRSGIARAPEIEADKFSGAMFGETPIQKGVTDG